MKPRETLSRANGRTPDMVTVPQGERKAWAWAAPFKRYERHLSAAAMVAGFVVDNFAFGRVDRPRAHVIFAAYLTTAVISILLAHALQARTDRKLARDMAQLSPARPAPDGSRTALQAEEAGAAGRRVQLRLWLPAVTQFALGGLWSGFLVFYSRSAVLAASWPFMLLLFAFLVGNEAFRRYHSRLVFVSLLLFFALYSYAVFVVPVFTKVIGLVTFLASGVLAIAAYWIFLRFLSALGHARFRHSRWKLIGGAGAITVTMNAFYFTGILPPLPLALSGVGVYHAIRHVGVVYEAQAESEPWTARLGLEQPVIHVAPGEQLDLYSAVFAPIRMTTRITHRWQWWDGRTKHWRTQSVVSFAISGGREHGYRGYSVKSNLNPGDWRVDIDAEDGRLIGRLAFSVVPVSKPVETATKMLQ